METILVYRTGQLGDTVCAIPAIQAIRENFKPCRIVLLADIHPGTTYPKAHEVLSEFRLIDDYILYNPNDIYIPSAALKMRRQIIQCKSKTLVYLGQRERTFLQRARDFIFLKSCGIKSLYGLRLYQNSSETPSVRNEVDRLLDVLRFEKLIVPIEPNFQIPISEAVISKIDQMWVNLGLNNKTVIAIGPGAKWPVQRWDLDNFRAVGERLTKKYGIHILILGGRVDMEAGGSLCKELGSKCIDLAGKTSYAESAEVLRRCLLYLGNDSGPMHLAAAVGTHCVAIFSARNPPGIWYPAGKQHTILIKEVECQGCMLTECIDQDMKCIRSISVDEVVAACEKVLVSQGIENPVQTLA